MSRYSCYESSKRNKIEKKSSESTKINEEVQKLKFSLQCISATLVKMSTNYVIITSCNSELTQHSARERVQSVNWKHGVHTRARTDPQSYFKPPIPKGVSQSFQSPEELSPHTFHIPPCCPHDVYVLLKLQTYFYTFHLGFESRNVLHLKK